ncbi:MAG: slipin family protein [Bacillota bacterium]|nr:slipin family protein [Bacillota bacterium]
MDHIINENQRGYLFRNGCFVKLLSSGKYNFPRFLGYRVESALINDEAISASVNINVLLKDKLFSKSITSIMVVDNKIAVHFINGRIKNILQSGEYYFWNIFNKHTFEIIDMSSTEVSKEIDRTIFNYIPIKYYTKIIVPDGQKAILYFDGKLNKELSCGTYFYWNVKEQVSYQLVDMRLQQLEISGQEILTTDKVSLRINFNCIYRIKNAVKILSEIRDYKVQIYSLIQLVLREYVGGFKFDELLDQKEEIAAFVLTKLKEKQDEYFIEFTTAGIKDIILPGEIKEIMNTVLIAEKTAQANVITRREEVASTRSLLNTAKLMDENKTLYKLKEMEYIQKICDKVGSISLGGGENLLNQLNELLCQK